ncbi:HNH endonuclease, partial [Ralstonia solanacearum]
EMRGQIQLMTVIAWTDNDAGYEAWLTGNPTGYVANIYKSTDSKQPTRYLKIHRATHKLPDRSNPSSINPWTGNGYAKVTSDRLDELLGWLQSKGFEVSPDKYCVPCGLSGEVQSSEPLIVYPDEINPDQQTFIEGAAKQVVVNQYERDPKARSACIQHWKPICYVCGFDFHKTYGEMGRGFIHVHHLTDIASIGKEYQVDPCKDLRPVCPNCHAMLHTQRPALDIDVLRAQVLARSGDAKS